MKKTTNVLSIILFIVLLPLIYIANRLTDFRDAWKAKTDLPDELEVRKTKTTYPPEWKENDFNTWINDIHKQLN